MNTNKYTLKILCGLLLVIFSTLYSAADANAPIKIKRETINILTWWGYLDYPEIVSAAEKKCNVNISFDEYFSNDEFIRRWQGQKESYDVIIFSDTIYSIVKSKMPHLDNSTLWHQSNNYNPTIKAHYKYKKYPHNVVYFFHAMTGFLWNPETISIGSGDSIKSIFTKAKNKYVVILDDPVEAKKLVGASNNESEVNAKGNTLSIDMFKKTTMDSDIYITNNYSKIFRKNDFAFSFSWSGEAIADLMQSHKQYKFLIHPEISYLSSDLISQTSKKTGALCISKLLTSKKVISILQKKEFYFSPYTYYSDIENPIYKSIYLDFIKALPTIKWTDSISDKDFQNLNMSWQLIKISLNNHKVGPNNHDNN